MEPVSSLMCPDPICVALDTPLHRCAVLMQRHGLRHLPVHDENGRLYGAINDFDVFRRGVLTGAHGELWLPFDEETVEMAAADIAQVVNVVVGPDEDLTTVLRGLLNTAQDLAIVVDEDRQPLGILTEHDTLRLAQGLSAKHPAHARQPLETIYRTLSVQDAFERMILTGVRHLLITEHGRLWGVVSMRDLYIARGAQGASTAVEDIWRGTELHASKGPIPLRDAAAWMLREHIGCLPIVDEELRPQAVLTRSDLMTALVEALETGEELA